MSFIISMLRPQPTIPTQNAQPTPEATLTDLALQTLSNVNTRPSKPITIQWKNDADRQLKVEAREKREVLGQRIQALESPRRPTFEARSV
ncbi:MAG: hypothetical protein NTZ52_05525 [Chlamydiae bacterium]|nr:hypothetical protein [Chlamydiota bacterium]